VGKDTIAAVEAYFAALETVSTQTSEKRKTR